MHEAVGCNHDSGFFGPCAAEVFKGRAYLLLLDGVFVDHVGEHAWVIGDDAVDLARYEYVDIAIGRQRIDDFKRLALGVKMVLDNLQRREADLRWLHCSDVVAAVAIDIV